MHAARFFVFFAWFLVWSDFMATADMLGPASKRTPLVISEIMYHPAPRADGKNLEFIEVYNTEAVPRNLSGYHIEGDVSFTFPAGTIIPSLGFVVVAPAPTEVQGVYGLQKVFGPFREGKNLAKDSGTIELWSRSGALLLEVHYSDDPPWPSAPDGSGPSLVLARPTYGQDSVQSWASSAFVNGSPGTQEPIVSDALGSILINELLAHTDDPLVDFIELYNRSNQSVNLTGCILTDDPTTNKFVIGNVTVNAGGWVAFNQTQMGFSLSAMGETVYLKNPDGTRIIDSIRFGGQENSISFGRFPDGGTAWHRQKTRTPGTSSTGIRESRIVINELMFNPISEEDADQFVEILNWGSTIVDLTGWRLSEGIRFEFPPGTQISPGGYLVVGKNVVRMLSNYTNLNSTNTFGNFSGQLAGSGERLVLSMPDEVFSTNQNGIVVTNQIHIAVDEVTYGTGGRWPEWADGGGSSLELIDPRANRRLATSWADSDETRKAPWTSVEHTGNLDHGTGTADQLQMHLQGAGECLVDDVEVMGPSLVNLISNGNFETDPLGWTAEGTQSRSSLETTEGFQSTRSFHLRAVDRGDTGANRIRRGLNQNLVPGTMGTIRAKARWLRGRPEMLLRLRGNYLEAIGRLTVPKNLGTPGARNSRTLSNSGPAIVDVIHSPVLPAANQPFLVKARVQDPDSVPTLQTVYRIDGTATTGTLPMKDDGSGGDAIAGDGEFTAQIPGAASGSMIAFYVRAVDGLGAESKFPSDAPVRECLVRIGETQPAGPIGTYRLWMTTATRTTWTSRSPLNNTPLDATFVYSNERVIYNMQVLYAGSPYIAPGYNGPTGGLCGYTGAFPKDDLFLGVNDFVLDWPGRDPSGVGEQMSYFIADEMGLPNGHRRFIHLHVNGVNEQSRGSVYEDVQQPGNDMVKEWSPNDADGNFYKVERWFEFSDTLSRIADPQPRLENYVTTGGAKKLARYRWIFLPRAVKGSVNDFDDVFAWVDAVNAPSPEPYTSQTEALADMEEIMGIFAIERIISNFDSWGHQIGKNMYAYKPRQGRWMTFMFDNDWLMTASSSYPATSPLFTPCEDPVVTRMYNHPPFRRAYFRNVQRAVEGMAATNMNPVMDAKYAMLVASGVTRSAGSALTNPDPIRNWLSQRRAFLITQLTALATPFAITNNSGNDFESPSNTVSLTGTAPVEVTSILVNGIAYPVAWTGDTTWSMRIPLSSASTRFELAALQRDGTPISTATDSIIVTYRGPLESSIGRIVFNEIMYHPTNSGGAFIELHSLATNTAFDLSNWRIEGVGFTFPGGTIIPPGGFLVVAKDRAAFVQNYGNSIPIAGEFGGQLQNDTETLWLIKPGTILTEDLVIDRVTYSDAAPWPAAADGSGSSLQLIDASQDNSRSLNWAAPLPVPSTEIPQQLVAITNLWKFDQSGIDLGTLWNTNTFDDSLWPAGRGLFYVESSPLPAPNLTPLTLGRTAYYFRTHFSFAGDPSKVALKLSTVIDDGIVIYLNGRELHRLGMDDPVNYTTLSTRLVDNAGFEGPFLRSANGLRQGDNLLSAEVHQNNAGSSDVVFGLALDSEPLAPSIATPGTSNSVARSLPKFPDVWLNELQLLNLNGATNEFGVREPWIEIFNHGDTMVSLNGWHLTDHPTNLTRWAFPNGSTLLPGERRIVWLDMRSSTTTLHANFRVAANAGTVALVFPMEGTPVVLDEIDYNLVPSDRSLGRFPEGDSGNFQILARATPGSANDGSTPIPQIFINEWMAGNTTTMDPSDGQFDDWFELYNPNNVPIELAGFSLTDNLLDPRERWPIPGGWSIAPHGFLRVWADADSPTNSAHLHANFKLDRLGESIGLFAPNGVMIDSVTFTNQTNNISQGRWPDGANELRFFTNASPAMSNAENSIIQITSASLTPENKVTLRWTSQIGRTYQIQFKTNLNQPDWNTLTETTAIGATTQTIESTTLPAHGFYRIKLK